MAELGFDLDELQRISDPEHAAAIDEALSDLSSEVLSDSLITLDPSELEKARLETLHEPANERPCWGFLISGTECDMQFKWSSGHFKNHVRAPPPSSAAVGTPPPPCCPFPSPPSCLIARHAQSHAVLRSSRRRSSAPSAPIMASALTPPAAV